MLIIKSKYRIAKRLGAGVFDQTQTQKFSLNEANAPKKRSARGGGSDYGRQLLEKQRVRFTYGLSEKQLSNYAEIAYVQKDPSSALHKSLEMRIDTAVYRAGLVSTRRGSRQAVSHGHITINGVRTKTPSQRVKKGDVISVRDGSRKNALFADLAERSVEGRAIPQWLSVDLKALKAEVKDEPQYTTVETGLDYATVFEFYSR